MANRFPLIFNSGAGQIQELAASDNLDLTSSNLVNAGILFTSSGSQTAPSISIGNGTTYPPGLYSPGTDQVAVATNGVERLRLSSTGEFMFKGAGTTPGTDKAVYFSGSAPANSVVLDSSGRLGIGNSSPRGIIHVGADLSNGATDAAAINLKQTSTTAATGIYLERSAERKGYYIYLGGDNDSLNFQRNNNGTKADVMTLTRDGLVGIGSTGPDAKLHITGGVSFTGGEANLAVTSSTTASVPATISSLNSDATLQIFAGGLGSGGSRGGQIDLKGGAAATDAGTILFRTGTGTGGTSQTEKARIDASGRLLVGTIASPAHQLQVSTDSAGKPSTNTWTIVSDERIKEEIELADLDLCYQAVKTIPLKRFKWKDEVYTEEQVRDRRKLGWIAQDVEAVFPKAVGTYEFKYNQVFEETIIPAVEEILDDEGNVTTSAQPERIEKGELISEDVIEDCRDLNSDQLYAAMYGAIQKLMVKVETLEAEVVLLKAQ